MRAALGPRRTYRGCRQQTVAAWCGGTWGPQMGKRLDLNAYAGAQARNIHAELLRQHSFLSPVEEADVGHLGARPPAANVST